MKYALVLLTNDDYMDFTYTMLASFFETNLWFKGDVVVLCDENICKLNDFNFNLLCGLSKNINIYRHVVDYNLYQPIIGRFINIVDNKNYVKCFYKYECFRLNGYDRVVFCDSDMIYYDSIKELFYNDKDLILMEDNFDSTNNEFRKYNGEKISTGGFSISNKYINNEIFNGLYLSSLSIPTSENSIYDGKFPEQQVFDFYFKNFNELYLMPKKFNCPNILGDGTILTKIDDFEKLCNNDLRAIHLFAKPLSRFGDDEILSIFFSYIDSCKRKLESNYRDDIKAYICTACRCENLYIREFVEWYKNLGFAKIVLYDNGYGDEERLSDVLGDYIEEGIVDVYDHFRDVQTAQTLTFNDFLDRYEGCYDWCFFPDVDEFLVLKSGIRNISEYLSNDIFNGYDSIAVNWTYYGDNNKIFYEDKPVMERFDRRAHNYGYAPFSKVFLRGGVNFRFKTPSDENHYISSVKTCNECGEERTCYLDAHICKLATINHYVSKSLEEYITRKERGDGNCVFEYDYNSIQNAKRFLSLHFAYNEMTEEKYNYLLSRYGPEIFNN